MPPQHHHHARHGASGTPGGSKASSAKVVERKYIEGLPSTDQRRYYDPPSSPSSSASTYNDTPPASPSNLRSNSNNKLNPSARFMRKGHMYAWGPSYDEAKADSRVRRRMKLCLQQFLPDAAADAGTVPPANIQQAEAKRENKKRKRQENAKFVLPHLASPSPPTSTAKLAPTLALPQTYVDIMLSPAMRHSLGDDTVETGLQRTAAELLEGEKGLMQALGRWREVLRVRGRDVPENQAVETTMNKPLANGNYLGLNGHDDSEAVDITTDPKPETTPQPTPQTNAEMQKIPPLPQISDTDNLWRVTQELLQAQPQPTIEFTITPVGASIPTPTLSPQPVPTPVHRLFTHPQGLTINAKPHPNHPNFAYPPSHPGYPQPVRYNLDLANQCRAVDDALERIAELLADCNEYKERLEEARDRVADVARARKKVWTVVKERAGRELDRRGM